MKISYSILLYLFCIWKQLPVKQIIKVLILFYSMILVLDVLVLMIWKPIVHDRGENIHRNRKHNCTVVLRRNIVQSLQISQLKIAKLCKSCFVVIKSVSRECDDRIMRWEVVDKQNERLIINIVTLIQFQIISTTLWKWLNIVTNTKMFNPAHCV